MTTLELTAVRASPGDADLAEALDRVQDLEGQPTSDATWASMVDLASASVGGAADRVKEDREWGSVQTWAGAILVDVLWQGEGLHLYYSTGEEPDERFLEVLSRLRQEGFTIVQGPDVTEVSPEASVADMVAAQERHQGL